MLDRRIIFGSPDVPIDCSSDRHSTFPDDDLSDVGAAGLHLLEIIGSGRYSGRTFSFGSDTPF